MTANTAVSLPLGPLDPERSELLRRVVDGLEPASLQWLSGFASGVAYARGQVDPVGHEGLESHGGRRREAGIRSAARDRLWLADRQWQAHRREAWSGSRGRRPRRAGLRGARLPAEGPRR